MVEVEVGSRERLPSAKLSAHRGSAPRVSIRTFYRGGERGD